MPLWGTSNDYPQHMRVVGWGKGVVYVSGTTNWYWLTFGQLIVPYLWTRSAIFVAGKGRGGMFLYLLFRHFHSFSSFSPVPQRAHNIETKSIQHWFNDLTLNQCWIKVVSMLCACWGPSVSSPLLSLLSLFSLSLNDANDPQWLTCYNKKTHSIYICEKKKRKLFCGYPLLSGSLTFSGVTLALVFIARLSGINIPG